jgi:hypothetical protein
MKLTYNSCKNAKPFDKPRKLSDGGGLYLEIMPNGSKNIAVHTSKPKDKLYKLADGGGLVLEVSPKG